MSSAQETSSPKEKGDLTAAEARFFALMIKHCRTKPDVDWEAFAVDAGFKNSMVAKTRYGQIRRKTFDAVDDNSAPTTPAKSTPAKAGVKKATGRVGGKGKAAKAKAVKATKNEPAEAEDDAENVMSSDINADFKIEDPK